MTVLCQLCHNPIPLERLEAIPDTVFCVPCLSLSGDAAKKKGVMVYDHKTAGALEVQTPDQHQRMKELPTVIENRYSRL